MPYYQEASGVLPDSITDDKLANMPEARVKGRAVGAGEGDPQDLTGPQITEIIGPLIGPPSGPAGGDLVGLYPDPVLVPIGPGGTFGDSGNVPRVTVDTKGRVVNIVAIPVGSGPPTGAAGGVLGGSYPNPNVLSNNSVFTGTIVDDAVTSPKIANANVTLSHIAANAISTPAIVDGAITTPKIADGNITTPKILDNAITTPKLAAGGVTNSKLAAMVAGTVKGRAVGAGSGDPQDLTQTQLLTLSGIPFAQCRFVYGGASIMYLIRHNGMLLTIDNKPEVIPVGGVGLATSAGQVGVNPMYVYAQMSGGTMILVGTADVQVIDPRNGMPVNPNNAAMTLVGIAFVSTGAALAEDGANQSVSSYFNRRPRVYAYYQSNTTSSTTAVLLHNPVRVLSWGEDALACKIVGYNQNNALGINITQVYMDSSPVGAVCISYFSVANSQYPVITAYDALVAPGIHSLQLGGSVNAGTGTFVATIYVTVMG